MDHSLCASGDDVYFSQAGDYGASSDNGLGSTGAYGHQLSEWSRQERQAEPRLIEQNFGKWEGTPRDGADFRDMSNSEFAAFGIGNAQAREYRF